MCQCTLLALSFVLLAGCSQQPGIDAKTLASHRMRLMLEEEPDEVVTVSDVRASIDAAAEALHGAHDEESEHEGHDHTAHLEEVEPIDVALVGQIGGLANPWPETQPDYPFSDLRAQFFLADPGTVAEVAESGHVHAEGEECAFCAAHAADNSHMIAMVRIVDAQGEVVPIGASELLNLKAGDMVIARGKARIVAGDMLVVDATGIYIRR
jgi:hypothetical protein